jgi:dimethylamine---corrinoid protein Co-methyltransferase
MEDRIPTRMGDGALVRMTPSEIRADLEAGTAVGAARAKVPVLSSAEIDHLFEIYASPSRFTGVDIGDEVVLSYDGSGMKTIASRRQDLQVYEQWFGADTVELHHVDYSFKPVKAIVPFEAQEMHDVLLRVIAPVQYGAQPNLGLYSTPDGPVPNWSELLPQMRLDEARAAQEDAVPMAVKDMVYVCQAMEEAGADGVDFDTSAAAGDADFLATLLAVAEVRRTCPDLGIEVGMSGEFVLGMHGEVDYEGTRLAGLWPREQMKLAAAAGATIFGPVVNVNSSKSAAWNVARAVTIVKPCVREATIPIHMNVGMGVGAVPMAKYLPVDAVCRASRACVELLRLDGL